MRMICLTENYICSFNEITLVIFSREEMKLASPFPVPGEARTTIDLVRRRLVQGTAAAFVGATAREATAAAPERIDTAARLFLSGAHAPGVSVAVMHAGRFLFAKGYGSANLETGTPVTPQTVFRAGSITKMFTASAIMRLVERGKVRLDDQVSKFVPELVKADPATVQMLLNHTSGLHPYTDEQFGREARFAHTPQQMVDYIAAQARLLDFPPGTAYAYSNTNFYIAGVIVARVSGQPLGEFLAANVIAPAGLAATALDHEQDVVPHRASGYVSAPRAPGGYRNADFISMDPPGGAGQLRSTASDLVRFHQALFAGRVVSAASLAAMTTPGRLADGQLSIREDAPLSQTKPGYGFGLELGSLDGEPTVGHGGAIPGFTAYLVTFPRRHLSVATMINGDPTAGEPFIDVERAALHRFATAT